MSETAPPIVEAPAAMSDPSAQPLEHVLREYLEVTDRLQRTHETLQSEIVRLRRELEHKDRELERRQRLASLGELAAGVAHEVRNPLGAIQIYSGLLRQQYVNESGAVELLDKIETGIRAIEDVVRDTLTLAPRSGRFGDTSLRQLIHQACEFCLATLQEREVDLTLDLGPADVELRADAEALQRVFVNLIANAAEASPPGATVAVSLRGCRESVLVQVRDEGGGISEELQDRVFDPFFTTKENGTGLGLAIAHRLAEAHGGGLSVQNLPGGGSEFTVNLPITAIAASEGDSHAASATSAA